MEVLNQVLGWFIIVGTFITYGFQYKKLYDRKTVVGINDNMLIMGCLSSILNLLGIITSSYYDIVNNRGEKLYFELLPIIQLFSPWICLEINYIIYYYYDICQMRKTKFKLYNFLQIICVFIGYPILMLCIKDDYDVFSNLLNVISGIFSVLMWIPQIKTTLLEENEGTLSLISVGCHAAGCLLVIVFQLMENSPFSTIIPYIIALCCEGWIVCYCLYKKYWRKKNEPLLNNIYTITESDETQ